MISSVAPRPMLVDDGGDTDVELETWDTPSFAAMDQSGSGQPSRSALVWCPSGEDSGAKAGTSDAMIVIATLWVRSASSWNSCGFISGVVQANRKMSATVLVGRTTSAETFIPCVTPSTSTDSYMLNFAAVRHQAVSGDVSRVHCSVDLGWEVCDSVRTPGLPAVALHRVVAIDHNSKSGTCCNGVRLVPHLPFRVESFGPQVVLEETCSWLTIGRHYALQLGGSLQQPRNTLIYSAPCPQPLQLPHVVTHHLLHKNTTDAYTMTDAQPPPLIVSSTIAAAAVNKATRMGSSKRAANSTLCQPEKKARVSAAKRVVIVDEDADVVDIPQDPIMQRYPAPLSPSGSQLLLATGAPLVLITTGMRLTPAERSRCESLNITVNPPMSAYATAKYLVIEPPLVRSVKLLTAIPFVEAFLHRSWLDAVLLSGRLCVPASRYVYSEAYTRRSIEGVNNFRIETLMRQTTPTQRQQLFAATRFYIHPDAQPQDEPLNDLKCVVTASGGTICRDLLDGVVDIVVLPSTSVSTPKLWGAMLSSTLLTPASLSQQLERSLLITVEELFLAVLRQMAPQQSSVKLPPFEASAVHEPVKQTRTQRGATKCTPQSTTKSQAPQKAKKSSAASPKSARKSSGVKRPR